LKEWKELRSQRSTFMSEEVQALLVPCREINPCLKAFDKRKVGRAKVRKASEMRSSI